MEVNKTSFSRLSTYQDCSQRYYWKYIEAAEEQEAVQEHFIKGSLAHYCLEEALTGTDVLEAFDMILESWVTDNCRLKITDDAAVMREGEAIHIPTLRLYAQKVSDLLLRAAPNYIGPDPIRKADGKPPENVLAYPTKSFQEEMNAAYLYDDKSALDIAATRINKDFLELSLANIAAEGLFLARNFETPSWFKETVAIEYPLISETNQYKPVKFTDDIYWNGAIDWIFKTVTDELVIADHKTSKKCPEGQDVLWHPQLNLYAGIYYEQHGVLPDYLAINHLVTNQIVMARPDPVVVGQTFEYFQEIQKAINSGVFTKHFPTEFDSPCVKYDYKTARVKYTCPYIQRCWKHFYEDLVHAKGV